MIARGFHTTISLRPSEPAFRFGSSTVPLPKTFLILRLGERNEAGDEDGPAHKHACPVSGDEAVEGIGVEREEKGEGEKSAPSVVGQLAPKIDFMPVRPCHVRLCSQQ